MKLSPVQNNKRLVRLAVAGLLSGVAISAVNIAQAAIPSPDDAPVDFVAKTVEYDDINQKVTAMGDVEIMQNGRIVKADRVVYNLTTEVVSVEGNVALMEKNGDVHFVDKADLEQGMKNGYVKKLRSVLADGSRFTASEGRRINGERIEMKDASYTPCEPCKANPEKEPVWQIKADTVTHDNTDHSVSYKNATFEVSGVPVAYVPYFSHPDGTVKQKSGFLTPTFSFSSDLGFSATPRYYWGIDPSQDATFGIRTFVEENPMFMGEYRKRFEDAELEVSGGVVYSDRTAGSGSNTDYEDEEIRGHFFGKGLWDIDNKLRAGFKAAMASDDQYLRQYDISSEDVLENELYLERFSGRDYATIRALTFQDVRTSDRATDQPDIIPEMEASFLGKPGEILGGRWNFDFSALGLTRSGSGQDVLRGSINSGWERKDIFDSGFVNVISANVRGDSYTVPQREEDLLGAGSDGDSTASRFYPVLHNVTSYPMVNNFSELQAVVEPLVAVTASTNVENGDNIPNEDSQDVQIDANNIFQENRFPGLDRVEDKSHVTYGVRTGLHSYDGSKGEIFLGQSYRLDAADNPFPSGSGLENRSSNYVGEISASYLDSFNLNYKFELASENLSSERHELDANATLDRLFLSTSYFFDKALEGTDLNESREQVSGGVGYYFTDEWRTRASARYDLEEENEGLRSANLTLDYLGQCFTVSTTAARKFTYESTGDNETEIMVRVGLKNLGEFGTD